MRVAFDQLLKKEKKESVKSPWWSTKSRVINILKQCYTKYLLTLSNKQHVGCHLFGISTSLSVVKTKLYPDYGQLG